MISQIDTGNEHGLTELVTGVVDDAQEVIKQQFNLLKVELTRKAQDAARASVPLGVSVCIMFVAIICLAFALAHGIASQGMPLWGGFAIVAGILLLVGLVSRPAAIIAVYS